MISDDTLRRMLQQVTGPQENPARRSSPRPAGVEELDDDEFCECEEDCTCSPCSCDVCEDCKFCLCCCVCGDDEESCLCCDSKKCEDCPDCDHCLCCCQCEEEAADDGDENEDFDEDFGEEE